MAAAGEADHTAPAHLYREASRSIYSGLQSHFNSRTLADISIVRPDGRLIHAHQVILAACSRKLSSVLAYGDATGKELPIQGVDSNALETVIGFFYRGEVLLTVNTVVPVYDVCLKLEVPGLAAACEQFVQQALSVGTCCIFLEAAVQLLLEHTVKLCLAFAKSRFSEVVASSSFQQLSSEALRMLLVPMRSSISDVSMARALARWAVHRPEHLAECEQLLKELNVTAAALLQLLQSPEFLQGLQQQQQQREAAKGAAVGPGAGAAAAGAAAGGLGTGGGVPQQGRNREWDSPQDRDSGGGGRGMGAAGGPGVAGGGKGGLPSAGSGGGALLQHRSSGAMPGGGGGGGNGGLPGPVGLPQAVIQGVQIMKVPATGAPINVSGGTLNAPKRLSGNGSGGAAGGAGSGGGGGLPPPSPLRQGDRSLPPPDRSPAQQQRSPILGSTGGPGAGALASAMPPGSMGARDRAPSGAARTGPLLDRDSAPGLNGPPLLQHKSTRPAWPAGGEEADPLSGGGPGPGGRTQQVQQRALPFGSAFGTGPKAGAEPSGRQLGQQQGLGTGLRGMDADSASRDALTEGRRAPGAGPQGGGVRGPAEDEREGSVHGGGPGGRRGAGPGAGSAEGSQPQPQRGMAGGEGGGLEGREGQQQQQQPKGSMIAVPLHVLEHAGMGVQLLASGSVAVSGGPLGSQRLVLQVVTGPQQMLLALVPGLVAQQMQGGAPSREEGPSPAVKEEEAPSGRSSGPAGVRDNAARGNATAGGPPPPQDAGGSVEGAGGGLGPVMAAVVKQQREQQREQQQQQQQREGDLDPRLGPQVSRLGRMGSDLPGGRGGEGGGGVQGGQGGSPVRVPPPGLSDVGGGLRTGILATGRMALGGMLGATGAGPTDLAAVQPSLGTQRQQQQQQLLQPPGLPGGSWLGEQGGEDMEGAGEGMQAFPSGMPGLGPGAPGDAGLGMEGPGGPMGGGGGGGKRRRASPEDDPDHVDEGSRGGGRSSRAGGYGGHGSKGPLMCHVDDCHVDLTALKEYHQRFRICDFHLKASVVLRDGTPQRFCQQCGRFHVLSEFDGTKRSCRARLQRHNARRRKRPDQKTSDWSDEGRKTSTGAPRDSPASGPNPMGGLMRGIAGGSAGAFALPPYQQQPYPGGGAQRGGSDSPSPQDEDDPDQDMDGDGEMYAAAALQHLRATEPHQPLQDRGGQMEEEGAAAGFGGGAGGGGGLHAVGSSGAFAALQRNRQELQLLQQRAFAQQQQQQYQGLLQQAASGGRDMAVVLGRSPHRQSMGGPGEVAGDVPLEQLDYRQLGQLGQQWRDGHVRQQQLQQQQQQQSTLQTQKLSPLPLPLQQQQQEVGQRQLQGGPQDPRMPPGGSGPVDQEQLLMALRQQQREQEREQQRQQQRFMHQQREQQQAAGEHMSDAALARAREEEPRGLHQADVREQMQAQGQAQGPDREARQGGTAQGQALGGGREAAGGAGGEQPTGATGRHSTAQPEAVAPEAAAAAADTPSEEGGGGGDGRANTDVQREERVGPAAAGEGTGRKAAEQPPASAGAGASAGGSPPRVEQREVVVAEEAGQQGAQAAGTAAEAPE